MRNLFSKSRWTPAFEKPAIVARFLSDTRGATAIEYGFIGLLVFVAIIASVRQIGNNLVPIFTKVAGGLAGSP